MLLEACDGSVAYVNTEQQPNRQCNTSNADQVTQTFDSPAMAREVSLVWLKCQGVLSPWMVDVSVGV